MLLFLLAAKSKTPAFKRALGIGRVVAYASAVSLAFGAYEAHSAYAALGDESLQVGRDLQQLSDLLGSTTEVTMNGQPIYFSASTVEDSVGHVLDRFQAQCDKHSAVDALEWSDLANKTLQTSNDTQRPNFSSMRREDAKKRDGMVLCFTRSNRASTTLAQAAVDFQNTGDLAAFGDVRYVHAAADAKGRVVVRTVWTQGSFNLRAFEHADGADAPGTDSADIPRPEHSERLISAVGSHSPYAARVYVTDTPVADVTREYDAVMEARGWMGIAPDPTVNASRWYEKDGRQAMVTISKNPDGKTTVILGEMGAIHTSPRISVLP